MDIASNHVKENYNHNPYERKLYRATAGIILRHKDQILLCKAISGHWSMPQGGIKSYETPLQAAQRELKEETGVCASIGTWTEESPWMVLILAPEKRQSRRYRRFIGQKYKWFVCNCNEKPHILLNRREFKPHFMWASAEKILSLSEAKRRIYAQAFQYFSIKK